MPFDDGNGGYHYNRNRLDKNYPPQSGNARHQHECEQPGNIDFGEVDGSRKRASPPHRRKHGGNEENTDHH